MLVTLVYYQH